MALCVSPTNFCKAFGLCPAETHGKFEYQYENGVIPEQTIAKKIQKVLGSPLSVSRVEIEVGYWRKANEIHRWFVENVQLGEDDCKEYHVSIGKINELRNTCKKVLENKKLAKKLLPPEDGFFFGSNEIDEYYFVDLEKTIKILDTALKYPQYEYYYRSDW